MIRHKLPVALVGVPPHRRRNVRTFGAILLCADGRAVIPDTNKERGGRDGELEQGWSCANLPMPEVAPSRALQTSEPK